MRLSTSEKSTEQVTDNTDFIILIFLFHFKSMHNHFNAIFCQKLMVRLL